MRQKIHDLHPILHSSNKCKQLFPTPPIIAYRRNRNLNDLLVSRRLPKDTTVYEQPSVTSMDRTSNECEECGLTFASGRGKVIHFAKAHNTAKTQTGAGFFRCGDSRCNTCKVGTFGATIPITSTGGTFNIYQPLTCKTSNIIYCVTCTKCHDQYIGETEQELHCRQSGHLSDIRGNRPGLPYVKHFKKCGIEHYTITCVEKVRQNDSGVRKMREKYYKKLFDVQIK